MIRYFFASTAAMNSNGFCINTFSFETEDGSFPSLLNVKTISNQRFPNTEKVQVISIVEMSESDFNQFKIEQ